MSLYRLIFGKSYHLPIELEHKTYWATKYLSYDLKIVGEKRLLQIDELDKWRMEAYDSANIYKRRMKWLHDKKIVKWVFILDQMLLLFN